MRTNNLVILRGNLGGDPDMRTSATGERHAKLTLAVNSYYRDAKGEKVQRTDWHRIDAWGKTAEYAAAWLHKGDLVQVLGVIKVDVVTAPTGTKTTYTSIRAQELQGFGKFGGRGGGPGEDEERGVPRRDSGGSPSQLPMEDVPF